jgi:hypothetical protein
MGPKASGHEIHLDMHHCHKLKKQCKLSSCLVLSLFWTKNKKPTFCMILGHCLIVYCCLFAAEKVICHNCILIFLSDMDHGEHISIKILK